MRRIKLMNRTLFIWLFLAGAIAGFGRALINNEHSWEVAIGRAMSSGVLGMAAAAALVWWPNLSQDALVGLAAALGSLGTTGLEKLMKTYMK